MISDPRWIESYLKSQEIEKGDFDKYNMVFIKTTESIGHFKYPYRMFFFKHNETIPKLILSLEIGQLFGTCALGEHTETSHINFGKADPNMKMEDFRDWALSTASDHLLL